MGDAKGEADFALLWTHTQECNDIIGLVWTPAPAVKPAPPDSEQKEREREQASVRNRFCGKVRKRKASFLPTLRS